MLVLILVGFVVLGVLWVRKVQWESGESARQSRCANNLSQIGKALIIYSNDNHGYFPPDFATLLHDKPLDLKVFVCPSSRGKPAIWSDDVSSRRSALSNPKHNSYIYCANGLTYRDVEGDSTIVLAYERKGVHTAEHPILMVLFADGHTDSFSDANPAGYRAAIDQMRRDADAGVRPVRFNRKLEN